MIKKGGEISFAEFHLTLKEAALQVYHGKEAMGRKQSNHRVTMQGKGWNPSQ